MKHKNVFLIKLERFLMCFSEATKKKNGKKMDLFNICDMLAIKPRFGCGGWSDSARPARKYTLVKKGEKFRKDEKRRI